MPPTTETLAVTAEAAEKPLAQEPAIRELAKLVNHAHAAALGSMMRSVRGFWGSESHLGNHVDVRA